MTQTLECTVAEMMERVNRGEIPPTATPRGTLDYVPPAAKVPVIWEDTDDGADEAEEKHPESLEELLEEVRQKYRFNREATLERLAKLDESREQTLAIFEQWKQEDALKTPEELAEEAKMYAQIERDGYPRFNIPDRLSGHGS